MSTQLDQDSWLDRFIQNNFWAWPAILLLIYTTFVVGVGFALGAWLT